VTLSSINKNEHGYILELLRWKLLQNNNIADVGLEVKIIN